MAPTILRITRSILLSIVGFCLIAILSLCALGCAALFPTRLALTERINALPVTGTPLSSPVTIYWNEYQIPFIEAQTDRDLAFALGVAHAHLREAQLAIFKRIGQGRIAEMAGPIATDIDHTLRILDIGHAAPEIEKQLPAATREFLQSFVDGLNYHQSHRQQEPPEYGLLGITSEPWTIQDILRMSRLAGADISWFVYFNILTLSTKEEMRNAWDRVRHSNIDTTVSFSGNSQASDLTRILQSCSRIGSNAVAIGGSRSASGKPLLASDPHLGLRLPNFWLLVGLKSPSYNAVGMMIPGVPIMGVGRNQCLAWGGTNMRASSSELYDVSSLAAERVQTEEVAIKQRFWFPAHRTVRRTPHGPIISDSHLFHSGAAQNIALQWVGYQATDEISAFLSAMKACTPDEFHEAFETFGVSGQNMLFATTAGDIGQIQAVKLPKRTAFPEGLPFRSPDDSTVDWSTFETSRTLPWAHNPSADFIASSNNRPTDEGPPVGFLFSPNDRVDRLHSLILNENKISVEQLQRFQQDVFSKPAHDLASFLSKSISDLGLTDVSPQTTEALNTWNGDYSVDSQGALVFELLLYRVVSTLADKGIFKGISTKALDQWGFITRYCKDVFLSLPLIDRRELLEDALRDAERGISTFHNWGGMHRLSISHPLAAIPVIGRFFVVADIPAPGSRETLLKSSHALESKRHATSFGSQSRFIADLSDPDANYFVLLGGEDGWLGGANYADQVDLFRQGKYVRLPLQLSRVQKSFTHRTELSPRGSIEKLPPTHSLKR